MESVGKMEWPRQTRGERNLCRQTKRDNNGRRAGKVGRLVGDRWVDLGLVSEESKKIDGFVGM